MLQNDTSRYSRIFFSLELVPLTPAFSVPSSSPGASSALGHLPLVHLGRSF
jgi:hypothetical protein